MFPQFVSWNPADFGEMVSCGSTMKKAASSMTIFFIAFWQMNVSNHWKAESEKEYAITDK